MNQKTYFIKEVIQMATVRELLQDVCSSFFEPGEQGAKINLVIDALSNFSMQGAGPLLGKKNPNDKSQPDEKLLEVAAAAHVTARSFCEARNAIQHILGSMTELAFLRDVADINVDEYTKTKK